MNRFSRIITQNPALGAAKSMYYALQFKQPDFNKAQVAIGAMQFDGNPCNAHLSKLQDVVYNQVNKHPSNNMLGLRFTTIGVSDGMTMGTTGMRYSLPSREIIADSIEAMMKAHYYDANITVASCDKNIPGSLMGIIRVNRPSLLIYGGSIKPGNYNGKTVDIVSAFQSYGQLLSNEITKPEREKLLQCCCPGSGTCGGMYTANTMACATEAMGMLMPYSSSNPALSTEKHDECIASSNYIYNLLENDIKPLDIITRKSLENAITIAITLGGSTNVVLHLLAIAKHAKIDLTLDDFNKIGKNIPVLGNFKPFGKFLMYDLYKHGGTPTVLKYLLDNDLLHGDCMTVTGKTMKENLQNITYNFDKEMICCDKPIKNSSHIRVLYGNLSPNGSVAKITGLEGDYFEGTAQVYNSEDDFIADLEKGLIKEGMAIVIRYQGPKGSPGMPEMLRATSAIVGYNLKNKIAFLTDGRFSGGSTGFIIGHISPEAYSGGPIAFVQTGDKIIIDATKNTIDFYTNQYNKDIRLLKRHWKIPDNVENNVENYGYLQKYRKLVSGAETGCILE